MLRKDTKPACNQSTLTHRNQNGYSLTAILRTQAPARATIQPVSAARKPVIVRKLTRDWCAGYAAANPSSDSSDLELLDSTGKLLRIEWAQVKWVCYVRELNTGDGSARLSGNDSSNPERLLRRRFTSRPRVAGLWLKITLTDGDELEGVIANDRSLVDGAGLLLTPPDTRSNTQRVFVPRSSIRELTVLGVISPAGPARQKTGAQPELFDNPANDEQIS
jgi:hypothetical protein